MKRFNKFLALFLAVVMAVGMLPAGVSAAENSNVILDEGFESWVPANFEPLADENKQNSKSGSINWNGASKPAEWNLGVNNGEVMVEPVKEDNGNVYMKLTTKVQDSSQHKISRAKLYYTMPAALYEKMEHGTEYVVSFRLKGTVAKANYEIKTYVEGLSSWPSSDFAVTSDWAEYTYTFTLDKNAKNPAAGVTTIQIYVGNIWLANTPLGQELCIDNVSITKTKTPYEEMVEELTDGNAQLKADVDGTGNDLVLKTGRTLDLFGHTLTIDSLTALKGANVIDSVGGGKLVVAKEALLLQKTNSYLPVKVDGGYAFVSVKNQHEQKAAEVDTLTYSSRPSLGENYLADGAVDNGLSVIFRLTWTNGSNGTTTTMDVPCSEEIIKQVYSQSGNAFELTVTGVDKVENLKIATVVTSDTGVAVVGESLAYVAN